MSGDSLIALINTHLERYPEAALLDVYKLLFQATYGPGHLIPNRKTAQQWLEAEMNLAGSEPGRALIENIHPQGEIVRLYLQPYQALGGKIKPLMDAFVHSAEQVQGDPAVMAQRWQTFEAMCKTDPICTARFSLREAVILGHVRAGENWPAAPHSPVYHRAYRPHYRVLTRPEAEKLCQRQKLPFEVI